MAYNFPKPQRLFSCSNSIESLRCSQCANFETHNVLHLKFHLKANHTLLKFEEQRHKCENCSFRTDSTYLFLRHNNFKPCRSLQPEATAHNNNVKNSNRTLNNSSKNKLRTCNHCPYETKDLSNLKTHILVKHTDPSKIKWFQCEHCSYRGKTKCHLKHHVDYHHRADIRFKCLSCPYQTKLKKALQSHVLARHTDPYDIQWFECEQCPYKCKTKPQLKQHVGYEHGDKAKLKCGECRFETKYNYHLQAHVVAKHTAPDQIQEWFKCENCSYKAKTKAALKAHRDRVHGNRAKIRCEHCEFETKCKRNMKNHVVLRHMDPETTEWFHCELCPYRARIKKTLQYHVSRHDAKDRRTAKQEKCF